MPGATPQYPLEFKREAVRLYRSSDRSIPKIARELGISPETLRNWAKQAARSTKVSEKDSPPRRARGAQKAAQRGEGPSPGEGDPKKSDGLLRQGGRDPVSAYTSSSMRRRPTIPSRPCAGLWASRGAATTIGRTGRLREEGARIRPSPTRSTDEIREIHQRSRQAYGSPRIHAELRSVGIRCGRSKRVERLMRESAIRGCVRGRRKRTTRRDKDAVPAEDLVGRDFTAAAPDKLWAADITCIDTEEGFLYLAFVLDAYSRRLVGWAMKSHLPARSL